MYTYGVSNFSSTSKSEITKQRYKTICRANVKHSSIRQIARDEQCSGDGLSELKIFCSCSLLIDRFKQLQHSKLSGNVMQQKGAMMQTRSVMQERGGVMRLV